MSKRTKILIICGIGLLFVVIVVMVATLVLRRPKQPDFVIETVGAQNLGLEGSYYKWENVDEQKIAPSWKLWYKTDWPDELSTLAPPRANDASSPRREGEKAQHVYWKDWKNFDACIYQQVSGLTVGNYVRFSVWAQVRTDMGLHDMQTRIGMDPNGGTNPLDIQYETHPANWDVYTVGSGQWQQMAVTLKATSGTATIYACAHPRWPMRFDVYWDDATFSTVPEKLVFLPLILKEFWVPPDPGTLYNPDLELDWGRKKGYQLPLEGYTNVYIAPYWMPFWNDNYNPDTGEFAQPEYNYADRDYRVHSGAVAQQYGLSAWGGFEAGIYQVITGTTPGETVQFTMWGVGWSSDSGGNDRVSDVQEGLNFRIGIDPYGSESYTSTQIIWSDLYDPYDEWHRFEITATVQSDRISVWAYTYPSAYWVRFNQIFWDDANLVVIDKP
jgi:hypothetical protein